MTSTIVSSKASKAKVPHRPCVARQAPPMPLGAALDRRVRGHGDARLDQDRPHMGLVHGHLEGLQAGPDDGTVVSEGADDGEVHLLVVERDHVDPISQGAHVALDQWGSQQHFGRDGAGGILGTLRQDRHREAESAARLGAVPVARPIA